MSGRRTSLTRENIFQNSASSDRQRMIKGSCSQPSTTPTHTPSSNSKNTGSVGTPGSARYGLYENTGRDSSPEDDQFQRLASARHRGKMWPSQNSNSGYADQDVFLYETRRAAWDYHTFRNGWLLLAMACIAFGGWGLWGRAELATVYRSVARYMFLLGMLAVAVAVLTCVFIALWVKRENDALLENRLQLLHHDVMRRLQSRGMLVIIHTRDELCTADGTLVWSRLEKRVCEDSRVRTQRELVQGEEQRVWKWLGHPSAGTGDNKDHQYSGGDTSQVLSPFRTRPPSPAFTATHSTSHTPAPPNQAPTNTTSLYPDVG